MSPTHKTTTTTGQQQANRLVKDIGATLDASDYDTFAKVVVTVLHKSQRVLPLITMLITDELCRTTTASKTSLFRANTFASALDKAFISL